jgi:hypothetical protein
VGIGVGAGIDVGISVHGGIDTRGVRVCTKLRISIGGQRAHTLKDASGNAAALPMKRTVLPGFEYPVDTTQQNVTVALITVYRAGGWSFSVSATARRSCESEDIEVSVS